LTALYVGYDDGGFSSCGPFAMSRRAALKAPADAAFVVQSIERTPSGTPSVKFIELRSDGSRIDVVDRPDFAFDPRTRPWYVKAASTQDQVQTDPYAFFTTHEPGITFARKTRAGRGVVGADITLTNLSELLRQQQVAPSTQLFLLSGTGLVVARNAAGSVARNDGFRRPGSRRCPRSAACFALAPRFLAGAMDRTSPSSRWAASGWRSTASSTKARLYSAAAPVDELLEGVNKIRRESLLVTMALIATHCRSPGSRRRAYRARCATSAMRARSRHATSPSVRACLRSCAIDQLSRAMHAARQVRRF
jgi:hypothetical protein